MQPSGGRRADAVAQSFAYARYKPPFEVTGDAGLSDTDVGIENLREFGLAVSTDQMRAADGSHCAWNMRSERP